MIDDPGPSVQLSAFAADGMELLLLFWIRDPENGQGNVKSEVNLAVLAVLNAEGIEIPYPQRVVRTLARTDGKGPGRSVARPSRLATMSRDPFGPDAAPGPEKARMLAGDLYDPSDPQLVSERRRARQLCHDFNASHPDADELRRELLGRLLRKPVTADINPPFFCDYGYNIELGEAVYFNVDCVVLDVARVAIGSRVLFGPGVHVYAATHPLDAAQRRLGLESGKPVAIGDDAWIGGGAIVCPGVTIGAATVVGAGSVVTRSLPAGVLAAGNPCRVLRRL